MTMKRMTMTDDETFDTPEAAIEAAMARIIEDLEAYARARGDCDAAQIARRQHLLRQLLNDRCEIMRAMLENRATNLH
jgi:hypothetical protein